MSQSDGTRAVRIDKSLSEEVHRFFDSLKLRVVEEASKRALEQSTGNSDCLIREGDLIDAARIQFASAVDEFAQLLDRESRYVREAS